MDFGIWEKNGQNVMISSVFVLCLCLIDVPGLNCLNCSSKGERGGDSSKCGFPQNALGIGQWLVQDSEQCLVIRVNSDWRLQIVLWRVAKGYACLIRLLSID